MNDHRAGHRIGADDVHRGVDRPVDVDGDDAVEAALVLAFTFLGIIAVTFGVVCLIIAWGSS